MKVIVGLGNPGHTYHGTRHNIGFEVIECLSRRRNVKVVQSMATPDDRRPAAVYGEYQVGAEPVRLMMPLSMMNDSGVAMRVAGVAPQDLLIVCDDANLPLGTLRVRPEGGPGGHHGLESCLQMLKTEAVPRLRCGVGIDPLPSDLREFVLGKFTSDEWPVMKRAVEQAADACELWITGGIEHAMNHYNRAHEA